MKLGNIHHVSVKDNCKFLGWMIRSLMENKGRQRFCQASDILKDDYELKN
jgi:hypothetical protein